MNLLDEANRCRRCGMCQAVCPLYQAGKEEQLVARGKIRLAKSIEEGKIDPGEAAKNTFYNCLDCRACMEVCPSKVNNPRIVRKMREKIYEENGDNLVYKVALEHLTPYPKRLELARKGLHTYQSLGLPALVRLNSTLKTMEAVLPSIPKRSFRKELKSFKKDFGSRPRVAYFISCTTDILYPQVGNAVIKVLEACGFEVYPMTEGTCCGVPQSVYGHQERARTMALKNMKAVPDDIQFIVNDCATCGSALKEYPELFEGTEYHKLAENFAHRVSDISEFLIKYAELPKGVSLNTKVTYHDPCHLNRAQGIKQEPRKIIKDSGCQLVEMENSDRCCGGAGTFHITHPELSQKLLKQKIADIERTGAEAVVTGCPACRMQISGGLKNYYQEIPVYHPVELLAMSMEQMSNKEA